MRHLAFEINFDIVPDFPYFNQHFRQSIATTDMRPFDLTLSVCESRSNQMYPLDRE